MQYALLAANLGAAFCEAAAVLPAGGAWTIAASVLGSAPRDSFTILIQTAPLASTRPSNGRILGVVVGPRVRRPGARRECSQKAPKPELFDFFWLCGW